MKVHTKVNENKHKMQKNKTRCQMRMFTKPAWLKNGPKVGRNDSTGKKYLKNWKQMQNMATKPLKIDRLGFFWCKMVEFKCIF